MLDEKAKLLSEHEKRMLQQLLEELAQQSEQNQHMESSGRHNLTHQERYGLDEQADNRSETPSSNTELNEFDNQDEAHSPLVISEDAAVEMSRQLQFVGHQLVKLIYGLGQNPCNCSNCTKQLKKALPLINNKNGYETETSKNNGSNTANTEYNEDGSIKRQCGRKSKYCSAEVKKEVADYAEVHGATAAARKFDIPASVAAYYHRKLKKGYTGPGASVPRRTYAPYPAPGELKPAQDSRQQSLDTTDEAENQRSFNDTGDEYGRSPGGAFLRGRGRGRPKLIGDELDAELVEYMVEVKSKLPRAHLTASHALEIARNYIMEKAPQILEENGGHINLKLTWAMKLVQRTNERWRELNPPSPFDPNNPSILQINNQLNEFIAQLNQSGQNGASEVNSIQELKFPFNLDNKEVEDIEENNFINNGHMVTE